MQWTVPLRSCYGYHPGEAWLFPDAEHDAQWAVYSATGLGVDGKQLVHPRQKRLLLNRQPHLVKVSPYVEKIEQEPILVSRIN
jgi:hypothetical protein